MPEVLGSGGERLDSRWTGADGRDHQTGAVVLVSNDPYRLGRVLGSGTRPRLDAGVLGITVAGGDAPGDALKGVQEWSAASFEVRSDGPVAAGIAPSKPSSLCSRAPARRSGLMDVPLTGADRQPARAM